jgi:hypothetical protein
MKRILSIFLTISSSALLMLSSCKKNDTIITTNGGTPGTLTASTTAPVLDRTKLTDTTHVIDFSFTQPTYNYAAVVTNTLQIDSAGDNWVHPVSVSMGLRVYKQGYSTLNFNNLLLKIVPAGVTSKVNVRIQHSLSSTVATYSNVSTLTVTPFNLTSWLYVVGSFQGWSLPNVDSLISPLGNGVYSGIINFPDTKRDFLVLPQKTNYDNKYATTDPVNTTSGTVEIGAANNFYAPATAGEYIVTLNTTAKTITFVLANHYSIIGDAAAGWSTDLEMKYVNDGNGNWVLTLPLVSSGAFKIRQDDDWTYSWGIPQAGTDGYGIANTLNDTKNNNLSVTSSGTYTVTFNDPISPASTPTPATTTALYSVK